MEFLRQMPRRVARKLIWLAVHYYRRMLRGTTFIGITGSSGKTTTKDLVYTILSTRYKGTRSHDTYNGLSEHCRTVARTMPWHKFCVLEVASGLANSIGVAVALIPPDMGIVLTIGLEHYTKLRTREGTAAAKELMVTSLSSRGTAFINVDDPLVDVMTERVGAKIVRFGMSERADVRIVDPVSEWPGRLTFTVVVAGREYVVKTRLCGKHWATDVAAAIAVGLEMKVPMADILAAVESFNPVHNRMFPRRMPDGVTFIEDDWKAAYWSVNLAFEFMKEAKADRRIIVIGTVSDYPGSASPKYRKVAAAALESADYVIFTGNNAGYTVKGGAANNDNPRLKICPTLDDVDEEFRRILKSGDLVLLKGSGQKDHLADLITRHEKRLSGVSTTLTAT